MLIVLTLLDLFLCSLATRSKFELLEGLKFSISFHTDEIDDDNAFSSCLLHLPLAIAASLYKEVSMLPICRARSEQYSLLLL